MGDGWSAKGVQPATIRIFSSNPLTQMHKYICQNTILKYQNTKFTNRQIQMSTITKTHLSAEEGGQLND